DGRRLASAGDDYAVLIWDRPPDGAAPAAHAPALRLSGHLAEVVAVFWLPDGKRLVSADWAGKVFLWNVESKESLVFPAATQRIRAFALSPDGRTIAVGSEDSPVRLWDIQGWDASSPPRPRHALATRNFVLALAFSPD